MSVRWRSFLRPVVTALFLGLFVGAGVEIFQRSRVLGQLTFTVILALALDLTMLALVLGWLWFPRKVGLLQFVSMKLPLWLRCGVAILISAGGYFLIAHSSWQIAFMTPFVQAMVVVLILLAIAFLVPDSASISDTGVGRQFFELGWPLLAGLIRVVVILALAVVAVQVCAAFQFHWLSIIVVALMSGVAGCLAWRLEPVFDGAVFRAHLPLAARVLLAIVLACLPAWLYGFSPIGALPLPVYIRLLPFGLAWAGAAWLLSGSKAGMSWNGGLAGGILAGAVWILSAELRQVSGYPFPLNWSEGNRFWDYSILFGRDLYNYPYAKRIYAFIDWGRQSLWGLPFLFGRPSIALMRLWDGILLTVPYALLGWAALGRWKGVETFGGEDETPRHLAGKVTRLLGGLWVLLFLYQGPIYTPLVLGAVLVALGARLPLVLNMAVVFLAARYVTVSRWTWVFAPAVWAVLLAFCEAGQPARRRWLRAVLLGLSGLAGGYLWKVISDRLAASAVAAGGGSTSPSILSPEGITAMLGQQPLLWDRLLPNSTYPSGILLGLLVAAGPLIALLAWFYCSKDWKVDRWQAASILGSMAAFLAVGLVASVKIGGGGNLHNLDMFLVGLAFVLAVAWQAGLGRRLLSGRGRGVNTVLAACIFFPLLPVVSGLTPLSLPPDAVVERSLQAVRAALEEKGESGEVLFLDQRQLLTFADVPAVPLVVEYEKKVLMEKALVGDRAYFADFYADLQRGRFALVVSEPLHAFRIQHEEDTSFTDENNAFVWYVSEPVLCYYQPIFSSEDTRLMLLTPRLEPDPSNGRCPGVNSPIR